MKVAVVGAAGRMGQWFIHYLCSQGHQPKGYDVKQKDVFELAKTQGFSAASTLKEAVDGVDAAIVSVPIDVTPEVISDLSSIMPAGSHLIEVSSIKSHVMPALRNLALKGIKAVSLHPLFGPGLPVDAELRLALVTVSDSASELATVRSLFPHSSIETVTHEAHDKAMAYLLSLTYFLNLAFSSTVSKTDITLLRRLAGTTFTLQLNLAEAVLHSGEDLIHSLTTQNPYSAPVLEEYTQTAKHLLEATKTSRSNFLKNIVQIREDMKKDEGFKDAYQKAYKMYLSSTDD